MRYGLAPWTEADKKSHKRADRVAAASEAVHVVGWTRKEVRATLGIPHQPLSVDPLATIYGATPWEPWAPTLAAERFLDELTRLNARVGVA